jgi:hypothetical protein
MSSTSSTIMHYAFSTIHPSLFLQQQAPHHPVKWLWPLEQVETSNSYNSTPATVKTGQQLVRSGLLLCFKRSKISSMKFAKNEFAV